MQISNREGAQARRQQLVGSRRIARTGSKAPAKLWGHARRELTRRSPTAGSTSRTLCHADPERLVWFGLVYTTTTRTRPLPDEAGSVCRRVLRKPVGPGHAPRFTR